MEKNLEERAKAAGITSYGIARITGCWSEPTVRRVLKGDLSRKSNPAAFRAVERVLRVTEEHKKDMAKVREVCFADRPFVAITPPENNAENTPPAETP